MDFDTEDKVLSAKDVLEFLILKHTKTVTIDFLWVFYDIDPRIQVPFERTESKP